MGCSRQETIFHTLMGISVGILLILAATLMGLSHNDHTATPPIYTPIFYAGIVFMSLLLLTGIAWLVIGLLGRYKQWFAD